MISRASSTVSGLALVFALGAGLGYVACGTGDATDGGGGSGAGNTQSQTGGTGPGGSGQGGAGANSGGNGPGGGAPTGGAGQGGAGGGGAPGGSGQGGGGGQGGGNGSCSFGQATCGPNLYCAAPGCGAGTCEPLLPVGQTTPDEQPVCGCDGVTYWNESVAESRGAAVRHAGECTALEEVACSAQTPCGGGTSCNRRVANQPACSPQATGACWGLPVQCDSGGAQAIGCLGQPVCFNECLLIQSQNPWYRDLTCP